MRFLTEKLEFPDVSEADESGLLAIGGDLSLPRLLLAYRSGIFPWFNAEEPIVWWSPDPRFVLFPEKLVISKSMRKELRSGSFTVTYNRAFEEVITRCALIERPGQVGTWITASMIKAFIELKNAGYVRSVEVWREKQLVGGLYGLDLGNGVFCGESMFSEVSNASKYGFIKFVTENNYNLIDCQVHSAHLESLGAEFIPRTQYLNYL